ncbi:GGDEF domain-containing protein [Pseudoalteromonas denitrificans]|uniref:diguanylate cyclase n=1 Tax=Pseudoalteromonas denitrificans DSM 6059 TaxID=1123010 RepID=A0A1I1TMA5_9GAMM|nr:GGDEF domain-containing protein [Pseudoalteromonas denitrificans]SFD57593.1 diguanylate cyclase (GGDEF) domain-containing protein [Pseudoalteromonas denitrificans DSM 6059]
MIKPIRWTIAKKVGGTVFILLSIIFSLLIHSLIALTEIEAELNEIAAIDVPLTEYANEIEIAQLEQRILMDEFIHKKLAKKEHTKKEEQEIIQWQVRMNEQFELAIKTSKSAVNTASSSEFKDILATLNTLKKEHEIVNTLFNQLINGENISVNLDAVIKQDENFDRLAIDLIHGIEQITKRKANIVLEHEHQFAIISYSLGIVGAIIGISLATLIIISIKASINKISYNINLVSSAIKSNKDIPVGQVEKVKSTDEFGELSHNLTNMINEVSSDIDKREKVSKELNELATKDHLTQCFNRFKWDESLKLEVARSLNSHTPLSLIFLDIDHFKRINDTYGHDVGDNTLIDVVNIAQQNIRQLDTLYRTGGEEFSILLPNTKLTDAQFLSERIRKSIAEFDFKTVGHITISLGVTLFKGKEDTELAFSKRADTALYQAKESGRNKVSTILEL